MAEVYETTARLCNMSTAPAKLSVIPNSPALPVAKVPPRKRIKISQIQLNNSFSNQHYLPLAAGMLQAYSKKHLAFAGCYDFLDVFYRFPRDRKELDEIGERLSECDILGVSNYVWNEQHSLALAKEYKRRNPNGIVVFGGPQVPDSRKQFRRVRTAELTAEEQRQARMSFTPEYHRLYPFIDICVHGEGERVFRHILEQMAIDGLADRSAIPSISYVDSDQSFHFNNKMERMFDADLVATPSPFTTGVFDRLMSKNHGQKWIMMYETDRGCPYTCTYCDWGGATEDRLGKFDMAQIRADIMWAGERRIPYVFLCNANFGLLPRDIEVAEIFAECRAKYGCPDAVSTQNAKNPKKHTIEALKTLQRAGLNKAAVMSQQSLNPKTLQAVERQNMKLDEYLEMQNMAAREGIDTMTDYIIPLPEETYESVINGLSTLINNGQHNRIQFNDLSILRNTKMGNPEYQQRYGFEIVKTRIINLHGKKETYETGLDEYQQLVVGTNTMPGPLWLKTRTLCWAADLFYFNKLLQIPLIVLHQEYGLNYGEAIQILCEDFGKYGGFPVLQELRELYIHTAEGMRRGEEEYIYSKEWLDVYWPPGEFGLIKICVEGKLQKFYEEAEEVLSSYLREKEVKFSAPVLAESIRLNRSLLKTPFQTEDLTLQLSCNIWDIYRAVRVGEHVPIAEGSYTYVVDRTAERWVSWEEWFEKMVWWCNSAVPTFTATRTSIKTWRVIISSGRD